MINWIYIIVLAFISIMPSCSAQTTDLIYQSETLIVRKISDHTFVHISYLSTEEYGKVPCNGMIVIDKGEALVVDTPVSDSVSRELIQVIESSFEGTVKGVLATHFHEDCLGGLQEFHDRQIPSYGLSITIELAKRNGSVIPLNSFERLLTITIGDIEVINDYMGEGHTIDNVVSYVPADSVLFGGCLIKAVGAGKGNLADANTSEWPNTVRKVQSRFSDAKTIIPGHGSPGDQSLFSYTINKFDH